MKAVALCEIGWNSRIQPSATELMQRLEGRLCLPPQAPNSLQPFSAPESCSQPSVSVLQSQRHSRKCPLLKVNELLLLVNIKDLSTAVSLVYTPKIIGRHWDREQPGVSFWESSTNVRTGNHLLSGVKIRCSQPGSSTSWFLYPLSTGWGISAAVLPGSPPGHGAERGHSVAKSWAIISASNGAEGTPHVPLILLLDILLQAFIVCLFVFGEKARSMDVRNIERLLPKPWPGIESET